MRNFLSFPFLDIWFISFIFFSKNLFNKRNPTVYVKYLDFMDWYGVYVANDKDNFSEDMEEKKTFKCTKSLNVNMVC